MSKKREPFLLCSAAEIEIIARRALDFMDDYSEALEEAEDDEDAGTERSLNGHFAAAVSALRFCAHAAGALGDARLVPLLVEFVDALEHWDDYAVDNYEAVGEGIEAMLSSGIPITAEIRRLAAHTDERIRARVAGGLSNVDPDALALLDRLAADPAGNVRKRARASLEQVRDVAWWSGAFPSDPAARLSPEDALLHKATFEAIAVIVNSPSYELSSRVEELARLAASLPDPLPVELVTSILRSVDQVAYHGGPLFALLVQRNGGVEAAIKLFQHWVDEGLNTRHDGQRVAVAGMRALPPDDAANVGLAFARWAVATPIPGDKKGFRESAQHLLAELTGDTWPAGKDLAPLLDLVLAMPEQEPQGGMDWLIASLSHAFRATGADATSILDRILEARIDGYSGAWHHLASSLDALLAAAPAAKLRAAASRALQSDKPSTVTWALRQLVGRGYDEALDGTRAQLVERLWQEPRLRRLLVGEWQLQMRCLPLLRRELRAGELEWIEAFAAMETISRLYGGTVDNSEWIHHGRGARTPREETQRDARAEVADVLGPEELQGPPTEAEWQAFFAARARHSFVGRKQHWEALDQMPEGPWREEDRAMLARAMEYARTQDRDVLLGIASALVSKPDAGDLGLLDEIVMLGGDDRRLARCRAIVRKKLGVAGGDVEEEDDDEEDEDGDEEEGAPREWMDEEEGEE